MDGTPGPMVGRTSGVVQHVRRLFSPRENTAFQFTRACDECEYGHYEVTFSLTRPHPPSLL